MAQVLNECVHRLLLAFSCCRIVRHQPGTVGLFDLTDAPAIPRKPATSTGAASVAAGDVVMTMSGNFGILR